MTTYGGPTQLQKVESRNTIKHLFTDTNETAYKTQNKSHTLHFQMLLSTPQEKPKDVNLENKTLTLNTELQMYLETM